MTVRVRIAPSPTGNLHIGTARTAVFNWLFARHHGGQFILRIEDTDLERSKPEYTQNILDGLTWLGLTWDEGPIFQTKRLDIYRQKVQELLDKGLAYRCYTTAEELDQMREAQKAKNQAPRYDNRHRNLTPEQEATFVAEGRKPVIRFKIDDNREIVWNDMVRGKVSWKASDLGGDMVIARTVMDDGQDAHSTIGGQDAQPTSPTSPNSGQDAYSSSGQDARTTIGIPLYNFAVVVDDIDMQISHVIRGEDHIANTAKQILLYEAFGATVPEFAHTPLILNKEGRKLSKRDGVTSISDFKQMGYTAEGLANYMTLLGWSPPDSTQEIFTLEEAAKQFSFERVNKAGAKFDWDKLNWLNGQYIHKMPVDRLTDALIPVWQEAGYDVSDRAYLEQIVALIGQSLMRLQDAVEMAKVFFADKLEFSEEATAHFKQEGAIASLKAILAALENQESLTEATAGEIVKQVTKELNVKKGLVMRSLRVGLTGELHGPDLTQSWLILHQKGLDKPRLQQTIEKLS